MAFPLPSCWSDDERMNFLYQPFKNRDLNPHSYDAKLEFWESLLIKFFQFDRANKDNDKKFSRIRLLTTIAEMKQVFFRKDQSPRCLPTVFSCLAQKKTLIEVDQFRSFVQDKIARHKASWPSWAYHVLVQSPVKAVTRQLYQKFQSPLSADSHSVSFLILENLEVSSYELLNCIREQMQRSVSFQTEHCPLYDKTAIISMLGGVNDEDLSLMLMWLESEGFLSSSLIDGKVVYRVGKDNKSVVKVPSDVEITIWRLGNVKKDLNEVLYGIDKKILSVNDRMKEMMKSGNKAVAIRLLKKKKLLEKKYDNLSSQLQHLDSILEEIYEAETSQLVIDAYKNGARTLQSLQKDISTSAVHEVMDDLAESINLSQDTSNALASAIVDTSGSSDDLVLEQELNDILLQDRDQSVDDILLSLDKLNVEDTPLPKTDTISDESVNSSPLSDPLPS